MSIPPEVVRIEMIVNTKAMEFGAQILDHFQSQSVEMAELVERTFEEMDVKQMVAIEIQKEVKKHIEVTIKRVVERACSPRLWDGAEETIAQKFIEDHVQKTLKKVFVTDGKD